MKRKLPLLIAMTSLLILILLPKFSSNSINNKYSKYLSMNKHFPTEIEENEKFDSPELFAEYFRKIRTAEGKQFPDYKPNYRIAEFEKAKARARKLFKDRPQEKLDWVERGPANVGGRTLALVVDPNDNTHSTWWAGSASGGIWKTTDKGLHWINKTPDLPNLATTTLVYSKANPDIFYAGTGEGYLNLDAVNGSGIFKSTDHGETWFQLKSTTQFGSINRIVVDPDNPDILVFCSNNMDVSSGGQRSWKTSYSTLQKSTNGGSTWKIAYNAGANRIQQIVADPNDFNIQYATVNGVGVIKSTNAGDSWFDISDGIETVSRIELAIAPTNTQKLYLSVERGNKSDFYASTNAGQRWYKVNDIKRNNSWLSSQGWYDNCIAVNPYDEDMIYVGGVNIFQIKMQPGMDSVFKILNVSANSTDYMKFYNLKLEYNGGGIGTGKKLWGKNDVKTSDYTTAEVKFGAGRTQKAHRFTYDKDSNYKFNDYVDVPFKVNDLDNKQQLMVAFFDANNNGKFDLLDSGYPELILIYSLPYNNRPDESIENDKTHKNIYAISALLKDGYTWDPENIPNSSIRINFGAYYTMKRKTVAVTDGYGQFGGTNYNNIVHVDQHVITMLPLDKTSKDYWILIGNDGGVAYSTNEGINWKETDKASGYNTSQFYGCDKNPVADEYIGGTQDNGTWLSPAGIEADAKTSYVMTIGGDGFEAAWNYKDPLKIIGSSQFNNIRRTTDGGHTWVNGANGIKDGYGSGGPFVSKIAKSQIDPDLLFAVGKTGVWRSENFGEYWTGIPIPDSNWRSGGYYSNAQVEISLADPQIVWAGIYMSSSGKIQLSKDGGLTFNSVNNYNLVSMGRLSGLESHPTDKATAYALFSMAQKPKVLKTTDYGQTWIDISGFDKDSVSKTGFPDVAVYSLLVMPYDTNIIWAGTEIGIFESTDNGSSWHYADNGFPAVSVWQMRVVKDQIVVATHGRGIWSVTLSELNGYEPPKVTLAPVLMRAGQSPTNKVAVKLNLRSVYDSTVVILTNPQDTANPNIKYNLGVNEIQELKVLIPYKVKSKQTVNLKVISYKDGKEYKTSIYPVILYPLNDQQITYFNDFETDWTGFDGTGFKIDSIQGFDSPALQTSHKYPNNRTLIDMFLTPIVVADTLATFKYDDIAIVEPGDSGTVFGDSRFYDYVIVEATSDGFDWVPLVKGYDCRYDINWLRTFFKDTTLSQGFYRNHEINLLDYFNQRDTILIRFRLFADTYTNGWGWAINDIDIQRNGYLDVKDYENLNTDFYISQVYPNPSNEYTIIRFFLNYPSEIKLSIYDEQGRLVKNLVSGKVSSGNNSITWNHRNINSGMYFVKISMGNSFKTSKIIVY